MHDHRLPRHDRPPEPWLPHPGTPEPSSPPPMLLGGGDAGWSPSAARVATPGWTGAPAPLPELPANATAFQRFIFGLASGRKSIPLAIAFALLGPLGLFYVSILHGLAALVVIPIVVRPLATGLAAAIGARPDSAFTFAVFLCWCVTVPWAIVAARRRNARLARA
jgi:hypothetical protein